MRAPLIEFLCQAAMAWILALEGLLPGARLGLRGRRVRQTGGEILLANVYHNEEERCHGLLLVSLLFRLAPPSSASSGGAISSTGCIVPQLFTIGENLSYQKFWAITGGPQYPGYLTLIVAPEPSVERVAGAGHSTVGRIGTHMLLRVPSGDLVATPWG
jgi:hypothetical protein